MPLHTNAHPDIQFDGNFQFSIATIRSCRQHHNPVPHAHRAPPGADDAAHKTAAALRPKPAPRRVNAQEALSVGAQLS